MNFITPRPLTPGDSIAILSPASIINPALVSGAADTLTTLGYNPVVMPHCLGTCGSYSGSVAQRLDDLRSAVTDPSIRAIMCSRGGYGAVHLLQLLQPVIHAHLDDPKWIIGFSDISALHALWLNEGITSIHSSMAKQLAQGPDTPPTQALMNILTGSRQPLHWINNSTAPNMPGTVTARISGGNLAVLAQLIGTPFNAIKPGNILFIEDIAEPIYKVQRILYQLLLAGILDRLAGIIVGQFTEYSPDRNYTTMEAMISEIVSPLSIPVAFDAPIGHVGSRNMPLLHGDMVTLSVTDSGCDLL